MKLKIFIGVKDVETMQMFPFKYFWQWILNT